MKAFAAISTLSALLCLASGCARPVVNKQAAIAAASRTAEVAGYRLADYKRPRVEFVRPCGGDHKEWWISYEPRVALRATNALGTSWVTNRFCIVVDPRSAKTTFAVIPEPD